MITNAPRYVSPSIQETAFNCPHCGALAKQHWFELRAGLRPKDGRPVRITEENANHDYINSIEDADLRIKWQKWLARMIVGAPFLHQQDPEYFGAWCVHNVDMSRCYNCDEISIWVKSSLVYPTRGDSPIPNADLSMDIRQDFDEAGRIVQISPRGAAALLRLSIQKLCKELGATGKTIDEDIAILVKQGLDVRIQRSLDIVRVIGNEAVHPGQLDLRDDVATAERLFGLVNIIADAMITQPKQIEAMYADLPENKRTAIERRDAAKTQVP